MKAKLNLFVSKKLFHFSAEIETFEPYEESEQNDVNFVNGTFFKKHRLGYTQEPNFQKPISEKQHIQKESWFL